MVALQKKDYVILCIGSVIFLTLSWMLLLQVPPIKQFQDVDSSAYLHSASLFYRYGTFSPAHAPQSLPLYALGYSFFISIIYFLFGESSLALIITQVLMALCAGFLIFSIARKMFGPVVARWAFLFFSCNLGFLVYAQMILSEMLLILLFLLFCMKMLDFFYHGGCWNLFWSGIWLSLSTLVKLAALYFFIVMALFIMVLCWREKRNIVLSLFSFLMPLVVTMGLFSYHNYRTFGVLRYSYNDTYNLYVVFHAQVRALKYGGSRSEHMGYLLDGARNERQHVDEVLRFQFWEFFIKDYRLFFTAWITNVGKIFLGLYSTQLKTLVNPLIKGKAPSFFNNVGNLLARGWGYIVDGAHRLWVVIVACCEVLWSLVRYLLCLCAVLSFFRLKQWRLLFFWGCYVGYFSGAIAFDGTARYRFFFEFILIIFAAYGMKLLLECLCYDRYVQKATKGRIV